MPIKPTVGDSVETCVAGNFAVSAMALENVSGAVSSIVWVSNIPVRA